MKTTVIIPNYNGIQFLEPCLSALARQKYAFETIVVENGSTDGSAEYIRKAFPDVTLLVSETNEGFSGAVNRGIRAAKTPYVLLLNNDTQVEAGFVQRLEEALDRRPRFFGIQAKMLMADQPELMDDAGDLYSALGWAFALGKGRRQEHFNRFYQVFAPCAGAAIYRKEVMERIGLFDESHFAYLEDIDIAYRAKIYGYKNGFCPSARVRHVGSGFSGSRYNAFKVHLAARNSVYLVYKNMPVWQIVLNFPFLLIGFAVKTVFFCKKGFGGMYLKSLAEGVRLCVGNRAKKVRFRKENLWHYLTIQLELWIGMVRRFTG
ncbi:MAG: glycosyltransferase family 2 protein [Lachnospiraceae bacterium]|nr:glycosyltransferase family 2 protein [Lachnospiraceae bacterium]